MSGRGPLKKIVPHPSTLICQKEYNIKQIRLKNGHIVKFLTPKTVTADSVYLSPGFLGQPL